MGKKDRRGSTSTEKQNNYKNDSVKVPELVKEASIDPALALLFSTSLKSEKTTERSQRAEFLSENKCVHEELDSDITTSFKDGETPTRDSSPETEPKPSECSEKRELDNTDSRLKRKRKRKIENDDVEGKYMQRLVLDEEREMARISEKIPKRQKLAPNKTSDFSQLGDKTSDEEGNGSSEEVKQISKKKLPITLIHESMAPIKNDTEVEKASRTVFLANVSTLAITSKSSRKTLLAYMGSFLSELPDPPEGKPNHKVESLRFRSTAYVGTVPKKAAFAKKELMSATTKSTNAYVVYSTAYAAREAVKRLNGSMILDRHLRVDGVAHPSKVDHRRCVFVGNLGFVDDESLLEQKDENERKRSKIPSDVEEGLWRQFSKAGAVESVRVIRDEKTRVGKGFAYVQFQDPNSVEKALLFNDKKFPPMLPRILRVVRAKAVGKTALAVAASRTNKPQTTTEKSRIFNPKVTPEQATFHGRAAKLLGRAGAANLKKTGASGANVTLLGKHIPLAVKANEPRPSLGDMGHLPPQSFVFEGYRASAGSGKLSKLKIGSKSGKNGSKSKVKRSKRSSEWKKSGNKRARPA